MATAFAASLVQQTAAAPAATAKEKKKRAPPPPVEPRPRSNKAAGKAATRKINAQVKGANAVASDNNEDEYSISTGKLRMRCVLSGSSGGLLSMAALILLSDAEHSDGATDGDSDEAKSPYRCITVPFQLIGEMQRLLNGAL